MTTLLPATEESQGEGSGRPNGSAHGLRTSIVKSIKRQETTVGLVGLVVLTWIIFAFVGRAFIGSFNLYGIGQLAALDAVLGLAQVLLIAVARMNLAIGGVAGVCVSLLGYLMAVVHVSLLLAVVLVLVTAVLLSVIMGLVELKSGLSSFIVTLAFLSAYGGAALLVTHNTNYLISSVTLGRFGSGTFLYSAVCPIIVVALLSGVLIWFIYNRTSIGWKMLAVGSNERAARAAGVNVSRVLLTAYALSGVFVAVAVVMEASYELTVNASLGQNWLLPSFIVVVLGGVALSGGEVTIGGMFVAALFYDSLQSGLTILNVPTYWLECVQGLVLLAAVIAGQLRRNRHPHVHSLFHNRRRTAMPLEDAQ